MTAIQTLAEYRRRMDYVQVLKQRLWIVASQRGNLDPEAIRISQEMDEYIVSIQQYWRSTPVESRIG